LDELVDDLHDEWCKHNGKKDEANLKSQNTVACVSKPEASKDILTVCGEQQQHQLLQPIYEVPTDPVVNSKQNKVEVNTKKVGTVPWSLNWLVKVPSSNVGKAAPSTCAFNSATMLEECKEQPCDAAFTFNSKKNKGGNVKRSVGFVKRVARMPTNDRKEILIILKKHANSRKVCKGKKQSRSVGLNTSESSKILLHL